jgi:hypothetical protein
VQGLDQACLKRLADVEFTTRVMGDSSPGRLVGASWAPRPLNSQMGSNDAHAHAPVCR